MAPRIMISSNTKRSRFDWIRRAALLVALATPCGAALADDEVPTLPDAQVQTLVAQIDADQSVTNFFQKCPADVYRRRTDFTGNRTVSSEMCGHDPAHCLAQCFTAASGNHCFALALILQNAKNISPLYGEKLFQMACVSGDPGGCVNRGAGLLHGQYENDPFAERPETEREMCEFHSFKLGCHGNMSWGCTMLGYAYESGLGTTRNMMKARKAYKKACSISAHFVACDAAKDGLAAMQDKF